MVFVLSVCWYASLTLITVYFLLLFRVRWNRNVTFRHETPPGVSIVIAVKNGFRLLQHHLPALLGQDYPTYEIIIVDDHSDPEQYAALESMIFRMPNVFLYPSEKTPGKKYALTQGVYKANHPLILCTDADCRPGSPGWISLMVAKTSGKELVLGYSPYWRKPGQLNQFIRFETVMTGIQYFSWAMMDRPYMGVGRNMLYPKELFMNANPYASSADVPYGDDDLFVQGVSHHVTTRVALHPDTFVYSDPATTLRQWLSQKHRHLSAARYYAPSAWWQPGIFGVSVILHWFLLVPMLVCALTPWLIFVFFAGLLIRWVRYASWTKRLGDEDTKWFYPWFETGYAGYLFSMGLISLFTKKKGWT